MKNTFLLGCFVLFAFASCRNFFDKTIDATPPDFENVLVFHQFVARTDTEVVLLLTRNFGVFEQVDNFDKWFIKGAKVEWWENGQKVTDLLPLPEPESYYYSAKFPAPLKAGNTYEIRISHPDFPTLTVSQDMPPAVGAITEAKLKRFIVVDQFNTPVHEVGFTLADNPNQENYYAIKVIGNYKIVDIIGVDSLGNTTYDTINRLAPAYFDNTFDGNIQNGYGGYLLITDQFFNGQSYKFLGNISPNYFSGIYGDSSTVYTLHVRSIAPDYYKWLISAQRQYDSQGNPFAEPVSIFTNFEHGLGIFGLFDEVTVPLE